MPASPTDPAFDALLKHVAPEEIPASEDLTPPRDLAREAYDVVVVGDIMLGGRAEDAIAAFGPDYPFDAVRPLLRRASVVLGNLEGPFAPSELKQPRQHSYAVDPARSTALARAGFHAVTLANNHLMDCGREGVRRTLDAVRGAGLSPIGAGRDEIEAHSPLVRGRFGFLAYYWNRRCAAGRNQPGGAIDTPDRLEADIRALRNRVDRIVVTFHWGIPYEREPLPEDRRKARFAIECGADLVIGHHPHCVQPFEIYRGRPIFYSVGNFSFGSGNSKAEGLLLGARFGTSIEVDVHPLYVKNRDPRVNYQPKALRGAAAKRWISILASISGEHGKHLREEDGRGRLRFP